MAKPPTRAEQRKGAMRRADVPADVLRAMNRGELESLTLAEWLVVDQQQLIGAVAPELGLSRHAASLTGQAAALAAQGVMARVTGIGAALRGVLRDHPERAVIQQRLATHTSDIVREWAVYAIAGDPALDAATCLRIVRPFAGDPHMGVREIAWMVFRPHLARTLDECIALLTPWTADPDPNLRRFASEVSRPCGVWCAHLPSLKREPAPGLSILEPLRADAHRYVRTSVANWLNDASKSRPEWVETLCVRWLEEAPETAWVVRHATRTLRKNGTLTPRLARLELPARRGRVRSVTP